MRAIKFTRRHELNDPFECLPTIRSAIKHLERSVTQDPSFWRLSQIEQQNQLQRIRGLESYYGFGNHRNDLLNAIDESHSFLSMSQFTLDEFLSSILMWSHYANQHRGFAIEFNETHPWVRKAAAVNYSSTPASWPNSNAEMESLLRTKSDHWRNENEVRIIAPISDCFAISDGLIGQKFPKEAVSRIIIGARMSPKDADLLQKFNPGFKLSYARIDGEAYRISLFDF